MAYTPAKHPEKPVFRQVNLQQIMHAIEADQCVFVLGPRHRAKRELLEVAAQQLQDSGDWYASYLSLRDVPIVSEQTFFVDLATESLLISEADFFTGLYQNLMRQWPFTNSGRTNMPTTVTEFRDALVALVDESQHHLSMFVGDLEMAPPNLVTGLLQALGMVYTAVSGRRSRVRFTAVLGGVLTHHQISDPSVAQFHKIAKLVWVDNLNKAECAAFIKAQCHPVQMSPTEFGIQELIKRSGGDQFLMERILRIAFKRMQRNQQSKLTPARVDEAITQLLSLPPDKEVLDILQQVESDPDLLFSAISIAEKEKVVASQLPAAKEKSPNLLDLCGMFQRSRQTNQYSFKSQLWQELFMKNLNMARIGGVYAIAGYWQEAFRYLGEAIQAGHGHIKSELFTAVINAMYTKENALATFAVLGKGLDAMYPQNDVRIYRKLGNYLLKVYPTDKETKPEKIALTVRRHPVVAGFLGDKHSVSFIEQDSRLWIPLRTEADKRSTIGVVSIGNLLSPSSPYKRRDEVMQLTGFLHQATHVIQDRGKYADLLQAAEERSNKLNFLNAILTRILNYRDWGEMDILRLVVGAATSPQGLDFSRAILFTFSKDRSALNGRLAYGYLDEKQTSKERNIVLQQSIDEMIERYLSRTEQDGELQRRVENLSISLHNDESNSFVQSFLRNVPVLSTPMRHIDRIPATFAKRIGTSQSYALIPVNVAGQRWGLLYVDDRFSNQALNNERFELLQTFMNQAGLTLENARTLIAERERANQLRQLLKVEERINDQIGRSMQQLLHEIVNSASYMFNADSVVLYPLKPGSEAGQLIYDSTTITAQNLKHPIHATSRLRTAHGIATRVITQGQLIVPDVNNMEYINGRSLATHPFIVREGVRSFVAMRLGSKEMPVGLLFLNWWQVQDFSKENLTLLEVFANFAGVAIPSARRYQQLQAENLRQEKEIKNLDEIFQGNIYFRSEEKMDQAITLTLQNIKELTNAPYLYLIRNEPYQMWHRYFLDTTEEGLSDWFKSLPRGIVTEAFTQAKSVLINDSHHRGLQNRYNEDTQSALAVPVKVADHCLAVLYLEHNVHDGLTVAHQESLEKMATGLALILEQAERSNVLRELLNISRQLTNQVDLKAALSFLLKQTMGALATVDALAVYYKDRATGQMKCGFAPGLQGERVTFDDSQVTAVSNAVINKVWASEDPEYYPNIVHQAELLDAFPTASKLQSVAAFPLKMGEERVGVMFFGYNFFHNFGRTEQNILILFAQLATLAILRVTLYDEAEQRQANLDTVGRITPIISANLGSEEDIFAVIVKELKVAFPMADHVCVIKKSEELFSTLNEVVNDDYYKMEELPRNGDTFISMGRRGVDTRVFVTGYSALVPDVQLDPDYVPRIPTTKSELFVPVRVNNEAQYILALESDQPRAFGADDMRLLEMLAEHVGIALQNEEQFARAQRQKVGELTAMMATGLIHDINSAVASIPDLVDEVEEKAEKGKDFSYPLADLRRNAEMTGRISGRLREFVITGKYEPAQVDVRTMINSAINISKSREPTHVQTKLIAPDEIPEIHADELWLQLLVKNLLVNAYRAIPEDKEGLVQITVETSTEFVILKVRDNGTGIDEQTLEKIFEFGYTTKEGTHKMQGVGLYHSRLIAETHQGYLYATSVVGEWTEFIVQLPYVSPATIEFKTSQLR